MKCKLVDFRCAEPNETTLHECRNSTVTHVSGESVLEQTDYLFLPMWADLTLLVVMVVFFRVLGYFILSGTMGYGGNCCVKLCPAKNPLSCKLPSLKSILKKKTEATNSDTCGTVRYGVLLGSLCIWSEYHEVLDDRRTTSDTNINTKPVCPVAELVLL